MNTSSKVPEQMLLGGFWRQTVAELIKETEKCIRQVIRLVSQLSAESNAKQTVLHQLLVDIQWSLAHQWLQAT